MPVTTRVEKITPTIAANLLKKNQKNRKLREAAVKNFVSAMRSGKWLEDGAPIRVSVNDALLDGQHRLAAIVESKTTQELVVVRGLDPDAQFVMDTGKKRSLTDALVIEGEPNASILASIIAAAYKWDKASVRTGVLFGGWMGATTTPTIPEYLDYFEDNRLKLRAAVLAALRLYSAVPIAPRVAGLAYFLFSRVDAADADEFFARLQDGVGLLAGSPILILRDRLFKLSEGDKRGHSTTTPYMTFALVIKAWNFYRDGTVVGNLKFAPGGAKPETLPEPR